VGTPVNQHVGIFIQIYGVDIDQLPTVGSIFVQLGDQRLRRETQRFPPRPQ